MIYDFVHFLVVTNWWVPWHFEFVQLLDVNTYYSSLFSFAIFLMTYWWVSW